MLLLVVLPLHSVAQLVAGVQGHRHVHVGAGRAAASPAGSLLTALAQPLREVLDRLHAAQDPRLLRPQPALTVSSGPSAGLHQHGGIFHTHSSDTQDVIDVGDPADDAVQAGATAFLAWIPSYPVWLAGQGADHPETVAFRWRDRVVVPPLTPPRG